jgi:coenzyme F420-0:L-glutamate ligase / coenzyme F420-1:gamma-L-glutamate ligase
VNRQLLLTALPDIPLIKKGDNLAALILESVQRAKINVETGSIFILAQKVVSKAEGRMVALSSVAPSERAIALSEVTGKDSRFVELVLRESREVLRAQLGLLITEHRLGYICANAGIDRSNVRLRDDSEDWVLLLPEDPDVSCRQIQNQIHSEMGVDVGVIINDSHGRAWRNGTVGVALGAAGMPAVQDMRGSQDLFAYTLQSTEIGVADELAAAASLIMGQAGEGFPIVHAAGFPYPLRDGSARELIRLQSQDVFR